MICIWLRTKLGNLCDLPKYGPRKVECKGNQLFCASPLRLALTESEPIVITDDELETDWDFLVEAEKHVRNGARYE